MWSKKMSERERKRERASERGRRKNRSERMSAEYACPCPFMNFDTLTAVLVQFIIFFCASFFELISFSLLTLEYF